MKRSRLKLFKTTSMTISVIAVVLIIVSIGIAGYVGVSQVTSSVTNTVNSGASYDSLNQLRSEYNNLSKKYTDLDQQLGTSPDATIKTTFNNGKVKLSELNQSISSIESDINKGEDDKIVQDEITQAKEEFKEAEDVYNQLVGKN